jgi:NADH-quinone oxidoreductase subunit M
VEAPTVGSVILAGLLLKLGGYGIIRIIFFLTPFGVFFFSPLINTLSLLSVIYASLTSLRQIDIKRIIAYASIAHMNVVVLGIFSLSFYGVLGGIFLMIIHGLTSSALFFLAGCLYERYHTRLVFNFGGLFTYMSKFSYFFLFFSLANMGFPLTGNFVAEFVVFVGISYSSFFVLFFAASSIILSSTYSLWLYTRITHGVSKMPICIHTDEYFDLTTNETFILSVLSFFVFFLGIYPNFIFDASYSSIHFLINSYKHNLSLL